MASMERLPNHKENYFRFRNKYIYFDIPFFLFLSWFTFYINLDFEGLEFDG